MRLIDADKVIVTRYDYEKPLTLKERLYRLLDNQPTVNAIPIDYIEKWIDARARIIKINPPAFRELLATKLLDDWLACREPDWPIKFEVEENEIN